MWCWEVVSYLVLIKTYWTWIENIMTLYQLDIGIQYMYGMVYWDCIQYMYGMVYCDGIQYMYGMVYCDCRFYHQHFLWPDLPTLKKIGVQKIPKQWYQFSSPKITFRKTGKCCNKLNFCTHNCELPVNLHCNHMALCV